VRASTGDGVRAGARSPLTARLEVTRLVKGLKLWMSGLGGRMVSSTTAHTP
jgi:hypothetical protein